MNPEITNCIIQLCGIAQNLGVGQYQQIARMAEQNPQEFPTVYKPVEVCEYLIDLFKGPVFFASLSETDRVTLENCGHYIESVKPETEAVV